MEEAPTPIHTADRDAVIALLQSNSDIRLVTMIGFGYIERYLGDLIHAHLRSIPEAARNYLLKRPIKHLSDRIEFAQKLGSVDENVAKNLLTFADIRHRFAHHIQARDCTDPEVAKSINKLFLVNDTFRKLNYDAAPEERLKVMIMVTVLKLHDLVETPFKE